MSRDFPGNERPGTDPGGPHLASAEAPAGHDSSLEDLLRVLGATGRAAVESVEETTARDPTDSEHLDPVDLAEWIDGVAPETVRARVEDHLAACGDCRDLARQVGSVPVLTVGGEVVLADAPDRRARRVSRRRIRRRRQVSGLAAAVVLALLSLGILRGAVADPRLASVGVGLWSRAVADRTQLDEAGALFDHGWPTVPALTGLPSPGELGTPSQTRGLAPRFELLEPRWEAVPDGRPTLRWSSSAGAVVESIVVLDAHDRLVAHIPLDPDDPPAPSTEGAEGSWTWSTTALEPGGVYAWKVNLRSPGGEGGATPYVPFRVLPRHEAETLDRRLHGLGGLPPFLAAFELARRGVYSEARRRLAELTPSAALGELVADLDARQHLAGSTPPSNSPPTDPGVGEGDPRSP